MPTLCHALSCDHPIPSHQLMCPRHWYQVPAGLKQEVYRAYHAKQHRPKDTTAARYHLLQSLLAIEAVALKEGLSLPPVRALTLAALLKEFT